MSTYTVNLTVTVTADDPTLAYLLAENAIYEGIGKVPGARVERIDEPHPLFGLARGDGRERKGVL